MSNCLQKNNTITPLVAEKKVICPSSALWAYPGMSDHIQLKWRDQTEVYIDVQDGKFQHNHSSRYRDIGDLFFIYSLSMSSMPDHIQLKWYDQILASIDV